ncbi:MAG: TonB-dependent receptor plug domain-containing protein, partial [Barnesiella intestinihominis]
MMKLWQFLSVILILSISPLEISGQNNSGIVSGSVFNSGQEPLVGVSVFVKGTNIGTMTDADGRFSVKAEDGQSLEFRYIGYDTKVVTVNGKTMSVTMSENQVILDDVVVIGYGTQKKSDLTGSLSSVKGEDIVKTGDTNITQSLQGKAPGVYVTSNSGTPGAGATIRIRGYGSISTDLTPLYVVDGQPMEESSVNTINPIDIENVEVLKDASATAIYGSRGANGVILITTKKGKSGKTSITFDASFGWSNAINRVHMMNSDQLYGFLEEAYENDGMRMPRNITRLYHLDGEGLGPVDEYGEPTDINVYDTDWWNETTQTAFKHSYNLSVSGGT